MKQRIEWMLPVGLLLVVGVAGCGEEPAPVADGAKQSQPGPKLGRDAAIAESERLGGKVYFDEASSDRRIVEVDLSNTQVTDAGLENLKGLTSLRHLELSDTPVTDAGLEHLKGMTSLRELYLSDTQVTDEGVKKLQQALPDCDIKH